LRTVLVAVALLLATAADSPAKAPRVGVTTLTFTKTSVTTGQPRVLTTVVWYPAARGTGTADTFGLRDADVRAGRYPLVVFSHGTCGRPTEASHLTMALAAQGFVVAAPPHPGNTKDDIPACLGGLPFIDSAVNRVPDVRFVIDSMLTENGNAASRFSGRLRADRIAVTGLSFGGFTTLLAAQQEPRLVATLAMAPGGTASLAPGNIAIPTMVIGSEKDEVVGFAESEKAYQRLDGPRFLVELLGATHLNVTDECAPFCGKDAPSQATSHRLILHYALPFMRHYVAHDRGGTAALSRKIRGVKVTAEARRP
jgi:predicted dienelactone hydrolase